MLTLIVFYLPEYVTFGSWHRQKKRRRQMLTLILEMDPQIGYLLKEEYPLTVLQYNWIGQADSHKLSIVH